MGNNVYANGMAVAAKIGGGKVIAAFPDVCMSPPPPPAGPIPIPYPCSSLSSDLKKGSKHTKIGGKPIALKDSFFKSSPLGDEAATKNFGASLLSHQTGGKTQFAAYSFDVMVEGKNVCRHVDLTTSNHASYPGSTPPFPNMEAMTQVALKRIALEHCACCNEPKHSEGSPMNRDEWYHHNIELCGVEQQKASKWSNRERKNRVAQMKKDYRALAADAKERKGCSCPKGTKVVPEPPCDVFYSKAQIGAKNGKRERQKVEINKKWKDELQENYARVHKIPSPRLIKRELAIKLKREPTRKEASAAVKSGRRTNHLTPKIAGGCPGGNQSGNLQPNYKLCDPCQALDDRFGKFQQDGMPA